MHKTLLSKSAFCSLPLRRPHVVCGKLRNTCSHVVWPVDQWPSFRIFHSSFYLPHSTFRILPTDLVDLSHRLLVYLRPPQMMPGGNNLGTEALAKKSVLHICAWANVLANATNQIREISSALLHTPSSHTTNYQRAGVSIVTAASLRHLIFTEKMPACLITHFTTETTVTM